VDEEVLDIVSDEDIVIGRMERSLIRSTRMRNFRVINAFIINSQKQLWIPTRHPSKQSFPLCLDCSIAGHVQSQESYLDAFIRESLEETGINPLEKNYRVLGKLTPHTDQTSSFMYVYALYDDGPIQYNENDFVHAEWLFPDQFRKRLEAGAAAKSDLRIILDSFEDKLKGALSRL
jgi:isopentenyldiphosphate isomerase